MTVQALPEDSGMERQSRDQIREDARRSAVRKWADRFPSLTVPEAAELCSISPEHLYRLVRTGAFPSVRLEGRYVIPAEAIERLFKAAGKQHGDEASESTPSNDLGGVS